MRLYNTTLYDIYCEEAAMSTKKSIKRKRRDEPARKRASPPPPPNGWERVTEPSGFSYLVKPGLEEFRAYEASIAVELPDNERG